MNLTETVRGQFKKKRYVDSDTRDGHGYTELLANPSNQNWRTLNSRLDESFIFFLALRIAVWSVDCPWNSDLKYKPN